MLATVVYAGELTTSLDHVPTVAKDYDDPAWAWAD